MRTYGLPWLYFWGGGRCDKGRVCFLIKRPKAILWALGPIHSPVLSFCKADSACIFLQGNEFFVAKDYANAVVWYSKAIDIDPSNEAYYSNRSGEEQLGIARPPRPPYYSRLPRQLSARGKLQLRLVFFVFLPLLPSLFLFFFLSPLQRRMRASRIGRRRPTTARRASGPTRRSSRATSGR